MKARKFLGLALAVIMGISFNPIQSFAAEGAEVLQFQKEVIPSNGTSVEEVHSVEGTIVTRAAGITAASVTLDFTSEGARMQFYTQASQISEEVGVKDVKLQEKSGLFWVTIATGEHDGLCDTDNYRASSFCSNVVSGKTYRVTCTHFAYIGGNDITQPGKSDEVKCP